MSEDLIKRVEQLEKDIKEIKRDIRVVAQSLLDHERGNMTLDDLQMCYNAIMKVKKMVSGVGGTRPASLEEKLAEMLVQQKEEPVITRGEIGEDELKQLRSKYLNKGDKQ
ncbi:MAG: hypothetical protein QW745_09190 [Thermoplasmata archaeon]|jgi:uncharacterized protein YfkK (UPF0435 family)|nr:hypothetical protein [Staphylococcus epidermidis]